MIKTEYKAGDDQDRVQSCPVGLLQYGVRHSLKVVEDPVQTKGNTT